MMPATKLRGTPSLTPDKVFHALGDPTRRTLIETLCARPQSISGLAAVMHITLAAVVQHIQILEGSGLVQTQKSGRVRTCQINPEGFNLIDRWVADRRSMWEKRLDRLGDLLEED